MRAVKRARGFFKRSLSAGAASAGVSEVAAFTLQAGDAPGDSP
jgi:hypothetical protein